MSTFKAYLITPEAGPREYETARDRAVARAREVGGSFDLVDLPATKTDLIPFLNAREREIATPGPGECPNAPPALEPPPPARLAPVPAAPPAFNSRNVSDWLMDEASQAEIESVFAALGCRFGEKVRAERKAA